MPASLTPLELPAQHLCAAPVHMTEPRDAIRCAYQQTRRLHETMPAPDSRPAPGESVSLREGCGT